LKNRGGKNDEVSRRVQKEVEGRKADKTRWKKQEEQEEKKERRKPMIEEVRMIERIIEEKEEEEEDLIELRATDEMVPR